MAHMIVSTVLSDRDLVRVSRGRAPFVTSRRKGGVALSQIQPASIDLTLSHEIFGRGRATLPGEGVDMRGLLQKSQYQFGLTPKQKGFLHVGYTYIIPLNEGLALPSGFSAKFSPKSSTGRIDVFVRVIADGVPRFDHVPEGYEGNLYLEITPLSFPVNIEPLLSLVQMRIRNGDARLNGAEVALIHAEEGIFHDKNGKVIPPRRLDTAEQGVYMHIDLDRPIAGFESRMHVDEALTLSQVDHADPRDYWVPIRGPLKRFTLAHDRFYLLPTEEMVSIPNHLCGDIAQYDATTGEFRTHYAGFFDPGFGKRRGKKQGTTGVLEVRGREMPHELSHGARICLMVFERVSAIHQGYTGHYVSSGPSLSKHFKDRYKVWDPDRTLA